MAGAASGASVKDHLDIAIKIAKVGDVGRGAGKCCSFRCNRVKREVLEFLQRLLKDSH